MFTVEFLRFVVRRYFGALSLIALTVSGCAQKEVELHPEAFNRAIGSLDSRLLLLNAVRASKNYPLAFTKVSTILGSSSTSAEIDPTLPLPFQANRAYDPGLKFSHERGFSSLTIQNLNTEEAQASLKRALGLEHFRYYQLSGWPEGVFRTLAFEEIRVHAAVQHRIDELAQKACEEGRSDPHCEMIAYPTHHCSPEQKLRPVIVKNEPIIRYLNSSESECQYALFQSILAKLIMARFRFLTSAERVKGKDGKPMELLRLDFDVPDRKLDRLIRRYDVALEKHGLFGVQIIFRSPERMVRYFGGLIALQNYRDRPFIPKTVADGTVVDLVVVEKGERAVQNAAVSVRDEEGELFCVPRPSYGTTQRHRTLQSIALMVDVLNSAVSQRALPQIQTLTLVSQ